MQHCADVEEMRGPLAEHPGALLAFAEPLAGAAWVRLCEFLAEQPDWSEIPLVLAAAPGTSLSDFQQGRCRVYPVASPLERDGLVSTLSAALEHRRRQFRLREALQQRDQIVEGIQDALFMVDGDWTYTYVNRHACELLQRPAEDFLGRPMWEIFPRLAGGAPEAALRTAMATRAAVEAPWRNPDWNRWFNLRIYPSNGGLSILAVEITEEKKIEEVLSESERRLHLALDTAKLGMWYCDLPLDKIVWDANCRRHFGLEAGGEVEIATFYSLLHPDDREATRTAIERAIADRTSYDEEYRAVHADGQQRWIHAMGRAFYGPDGEPRRFDGISIDITDRKETEVELERAREEAIEANRAKDHFLAALSHELRTPLTPVLMTVASMRQDPSLPRQFQSDLGLIHRNVELEARLIDDLLDLTRITRGKLVLHQETADLHEMIEHTLHTCCGPEVLPKPMEVTWHLRARKHCTFGDPARLQQVLWNLIKNALKFTPANGRIVVETRNPSADRIEVTVTDSGIGIPPEELPRLFEAFEQGNASITRRFGGLGLGLAISKAITDLHGGALRVRSEGRGRGSAFSLELNALESPRTAGLMAMPEPAGPARSLHILLVEDHEPTREVLARLLGRAGHRVQAAADVGGALGLAEMHTFDLLVSDLGLPDATGMDLMRDVKSRYGLRGIALSGYGMEEDIAAALAAGFAIHLTKPVDWNRLEAAISEVAKPV